MLARLCFDVGESRWDAAPPLAKLRRNGGGPPSGPCRENPVDFFKTRHDVESCLISAEDALDLPQVVVRPASRRVVTSGGSLVASDLLGPCPIDAGWIQVKSPSGDLLALAEVQNTPAGPKVQPKRVLSSP
jgi:hypothetical protein